MLLKNVHSNLHYFSHVEHLIILITVTMKITDYWLLIEHGSDVLPRFWVFLVYTFNHSFQMYMTFIGLLCSMSHLIITPKKKLNYFLNVSSVILWIVIFALPFPFEKLAVAICLSLCAILEIIFSRMHQTPKGENQRKKRESKFIKGPSTVTKSCYASTMPQSDLDLSKLDISNGSPKRNLVHRSSIVQSPEFTKPRPVVSPSRFSSSSFESAPSNLTKASWVAGGYWQKNQWPSTPFSSPFSGSQNSTPLTRSSSQSSGFGSVQTGIFSSNRSPPDSRPESTLDEIECLSIYSDNFESPRCPEESRSTLRYPDSSPVPYNFATDLSRASLMSSISSVNNSVTATNGAVSHSASSWSWLPFLLGFSLALNLCVMTYCVFLHSSKI